MCQAMKQWSNETCAKTMWDKIIKNLRTWDIRQDKKRLYKTAGDQLQRLTVEISWKVSVT